jgi:hypothetical protein
MGAAVSFASALAAQLAPTRKWPTPGAMACDLDPGTMQTPMLDLVDRELVGLADGKVPRLMVFTAPQEGKSQRVSRRFPAWLLSQDPTLRIAIVSYDQEHATRWGRDVKRDIATHPELGISLREDSRAAGRWETPQGGGIYCAGIAGALTGRAVDVLIVDDPVKDRQAAESATQRQAAWDWWESVAVTRLSPRGRVVLMMTRWHKDDLAGRILEQEPQLWRVVSIPAVAEDPHDPLGRRPGEELVSARGRQPGYFTGLSQRLSAYVWRSLYQQRPPIRPAASSSGTGGSTGRGTGGPTTSTWPGSRWTCGTRGGSSPPTWPRPPARPRTSPSPPPGRSP